MDERSPKSRGERKYDDSEEVSGRGKEKDVKAEECKMETEVMGLFCNI